MNNTFILRRRGFQAFQGWQFRLQMLLVLSTFISIGVLFFFVNSSDLLTKSFVYIPLIYATFFYFQSRFMQKSKLEISELGLSHESGLPELLKRFYPDWRVSWSEIQKIEHSTNSLIKNGLLKPLSLRLWDRALKVYPAQWVNPKVVTKKTWFKLGESQKAMFENSPLIEAFEAKGLLNVQTSADGKTKSDWAEESTGTDINSSPISISMAVFLFFAIFYFIAEVYFTLSEFYAGTPPYLYMGIAAVIAVIISYFLLLQTKFVLAEKIILAVLMGLSMAAVMYPLLLRINEWTDSEGLQSYSYVKRGSVNWESERQNYQIPKLKFDYKSSDYWAQFEIGAVTEFELRKGGLGFYQLNMEPIYEQQREFYKDK